MTPLPRATALLIIDAQKGFDDPYWGRRNNPGAEIQMSALLAAWRSAGRPLVHVQHDSTEPASPLRPGLPGHAIKDVVAPQAGERVLHKRVNSAFIGTDLEDHLRSLDVDAVVVTGFTTDHCVSTTARMAANLGFRTIVVSDATATFDRVGPDARAFTAEDMHAHALASLHREFAEIMTTKTVIERMTLEPTA